MLLFCTARRCRQHNSYIINTKQEYFPISKIIRFNFWKDLQGKNFGFKISNMDSSFCLRNYKLAVLRHSRLFRYMCTFRPYIYLFFCRRIYHTRWFIAKRNDISQIKLCRDRIFHTDNGQCQDCINFVYFARHFLFRLWLICCAFRFELLVYHSKSLKLPGIYSQREREREKTKAQKLMDLAEEKV